MLPREKKKKLSHDKINIANVNAMLICRHEDDSLMLKPLSVRQRGRTCKSSRKITEGKQLEKLLVHNDSFYSSVGGRGRILEAAQICDLIKGFVLVVCCIMMNYVDVSMMYHLIRGQAIIKLYLFYNMLEVS